MLERHRQNGVSSGEDHQDAQGCSTCNVSRALRELGLFRLRRQLAGGRMTGLAAAPSVWKDVIIKMGPGSSQRCMTVTILKLKWEVKAGYIKKLFPCSWALEQVAQRGCAVSALGGFQAPGGRSFEQRDLISYLPLLRAGGWATNFLRSLPTWVLWWCYNLLSAYGSPQNQLNAFCRQLGRIKYRKVQ